MGARVCDRWGKLQVFSLINVGVPPPFSTMDQTGEPEERPILKGSQNSTTWWIVTVTAIEVLRGRGGPLKNLSENSLRASPAALRHSLLRLRIGWGTAGFGHEIDADLGSGLRMGIESCVVDVRVLGPQNRTKIVSKGSPVELGEPLVGGLYADTLVTAHATPSPGPPSARRPTLTQMFDQPQGVPPRSVPIPPFARALQITRELPDAFPPFQFVVGAAGPSIRTFDFNPSDPGATFRNPIPQFATHVLLGAALPGSDSGLALIWELDL